MAATSPAKPWETNASSSIDSSGSNNSVITPPTPITKHTNNPHINRSAPTTTDAPSNPNNNPQQTQPIQQPQQQSLMAPGYSGYGGGMYGNSMYGNSMYGGGMYGNSMYGGGMGGGMYGGGYGMNGMNGMYGQMGPMGPMGFMQNMQMSVNNVGRFSQLLQVASQALHMTFSSLVQFAGGVGMLAREFGGIMSGVYVFKFLKWLYLKIKKFLFWIIGRKPSSKEQFEEMFKNAVDATSEKETSSTHYSWLSIGFYCFGILYIIQWIYKTITNELDQQKRLEQQQQPVNPVNRYPQNVAFGQSNPYGCYGNYGNNMYAQQMPMMQQQQQYNTQQQQQPVKNNNNTNDDETSKQSESLLGKEKSQTVNVSG